MKKIIISSLALAVSSAFAVDLSAVTNIGSSSLSSEQQIQNSNGSCDATCSTTTVFPGSGATSGTTLLSQAVTSTETQTITCVAAGHPATWTGSATQTRSYTSQNGVRIAGTETAWVTTADSCVPPAVVASNSSGQLFTIYRVAYHTWTGCGTHGEKECWGDHFNRIIDKDGAMHTYYTNNELLPTNTSKQISVKFCASKKSTLMSIGGLISNWRCD